jgi:hypothetical protein
MQDRGNKDRGTGIIYFLDESDHAGIHGMSSLYWLYKIA